MTSIVAEILTIVLFFEVEAEAVLHPVSPISESVVFA